MVNCLLNFGVYSLRIVFYAIEILWTKIYNAYENTTTDDIFAKIERLYELTKIVTMIILSFFQFLFAVIPAMIGGFIYYTGIAESGKVAASFVGTIWNKLLESLGMGEYAFLKEVFTYIDNLLGVALNNFRGAGIPP